MIFALKEENFVVIDNGSWRIKARKGVPKEIFEIPSLFLPTDNIEKRALSSSNDNNNILSLSSLSIADTKLPTTNPVSVFTSSPIIDRGEIKKWDELEALWRHILLKEFGIKRSRNECPVMITTPSWWTKEQHERIAQIFFEHFNVPGLYIADQALMAIYGCGSVSGLVVDIGHGKTDITPIFESIVQYHAIQTLPIGGQDIDKYLLTLLQSDEQLLSEYDDMLDIDFARAIKEIIGGFPDEEEEQSHTGDEERKEVEYLGKRFTIGSERLRAAEPFFNPSLVGKDEVPSLPDAINTAIYSCDIEKRSALWENIALTGGSSLLKGLKERLQKELEVFLIMSENAGDYQFKEAKFIKIPDYLTNFKERQDLAAFLGASMVAKLVFGDPKNFISKVDYNEIGPTAVHTKSY
ncbi:13591_t:CDS:2 [Ambispora leptoticha]|uniref:13591_t:CDS:1 n=1 Tax=Ambispora leptoticha TaxID=144679 RepID=A0A9N8YYN6_9GLOM|nr:13591_t:CDS:2 [Ambispora leptoticha]